MTHKCSGHAPKPASHASLVCTAKRITRNVVSCSIVNTQVYTAHPDARIQLLDPPDHALCTDRCAPALAPPVHRGDEPYSLAATAVPVWLPQQCPDDRPQPSLLHGLGCLAVIAGMLTSLR